MMSTDTPLYFEEFLEDCFNDALAKVREAFRTTVFGLNDTELDGKLNAEFPNWCAGVIETCWCNLIAVYEGCVFTSAEEGPNPVGRADKMRRKEMEALFGKTFRTKPRGRHDHFFLTGNMSFRLNDWGVIWFTSICQTACCAKGVGLMFCERSLFKLDHPLAVSLLKAFDKAVPQLWEKATAAMTDAVLETRNLIARYRIVRSSLEAFSEKAGARMVLNFDSRTEMFGVQFSIPPRTILSMDFSLDDFGDFFEWIPAYYNARLNGWEYWNLPR